jgi:acylphosphatase
MQQVHLLISGKVQGVFYRVFVKEHADKLGLTGWVRNTNEGHVEAVIQGEKQTIEQLIALCRQGSQNSEVRDIKESWGSVSESFEGFSIR